jgi:hypothetical protein
VCVHDEESVVRFWKDVHSRMDGALPADIIAESSLNDIYTADHQFSTQSTKEDQCAFFNIAMPKRLGGVHACKWQKLRKMANRMAANLPCQTHFTHSTNVVHVAKGPEDFKM